MYKRQTYDLNAIPDKQFIRKDAVYVDSVMDHFYMKVLEGDGWTVKEIENGIGFPLTYDFYDSLARYDLIVYVSDDMQTRQLGFNEQTARMLMDYLNTGGHLLIWGCTIPYQLITTAGKYGRPLFVYRFSIFDLRYLVSGQFEFLRGISVNEDLFPSLEVDTGRIITPLAEQNGAISQVGAAVPINSYIIYLFDSRTDLDLFEERGCGFRYKDDTYGVVFYTFPLYWMKMEDFETCEPVRTVVQNSIKYLRGELEIK